MHKFQIGKKNAKPFLGRAKEEELYYSHLVLLLLFSPQKACVIFVNCIFKGPGLFYFFGPAVPFGSRLLR